MCDKVSTGRKVTISKIRVEFYEYGGIQSICGNNKSIPDYVFLLLTNANVQLPVKGAEIPAKVNDKWIYIFKKTPEGKVSLLYEIKPEVSDNVQSFKVVSWTKSDKEKWWSTYPRTVLKEKLNSVSLSTDNDHYVVLSREQLKVKRIEALYTSSSTKLFPRALHIPAGISTSQPILPLYLLDYISAANGFVESSIKSISNFELFIKDEQKSNTRYLAEVVTSIAKSQPKIKSWLNFNNCENELNNQTAIFNSLKTNKENCISRLGSLLSTSGYEETIDDHNGDKELEEKIIDIYSEHISIMDTDPAGLEYLRSTISNKNSWLNRFFMADEPFQFHRKLSTLSANDKFYDLLLKYAIGKALSLIPPKVAISVETLVQIQEKIVVEYCEILERAQIKLADLTKQDNGKYFKVVYDKKSKFFYIKYTLSINVENRISITEDHSVRESHRKKWQHGIESVSSNCKKILVVIELINTIMAAKSIAQANSSSEKVLASINLAGCFADTIGAFEFLIVRSATTKISARFVLKCLPVICIIGAICDLTGAIAGAHKAGKEKNYGLLSGYTVIALSSIATGVAGAGLIAGATWAATLGLIGIGIFVAGTVVIWLFTEEELEKWAKKCLWGTRYINTYTLENQILDIHKIICEFKAECYLNRVEKSRKTGIVFDEIQWIHTFTIDVYIGVVRENISKFKLDLKIEKFGGLLSSNTTICNKTFILPNSGTITLASKDKNNPPCLRYRVTNSDLNNFSDFNICEFRYTISAQLDLDGDGKTMLPDNPFTETKMVEIRENDKVNLPPTPMMMIG